MEEQGNIKITRAKYDAYLGHYLNFWSYLRTYHNAFNALMDNVENLGHVDTIAYPMIFIARHCIELGFKANIQYFKKYSEKTDYINSDEHDLKKLLCGFLIHIKATVINLKKKYNVDVEKEDWKEFKLYYKEVEKLTDQFDIIDKGSFSSRYPVDKNNNKVFQHEDIINLIDIKETFDKSIILLYHTSDVFSKYTDYANMIEEIYKEEMRSSYGFY